MGSVFLSYEEDRDFAEALMYRLEQSGVQVCEHKNISTLWTTETLYPCQFSYGE